MNKKLKIAIVVDAFYPMRDGVVEVVNRYASGLTEKAEVHVITISTGKNSFDDSTLNYPVWRTKSMKIPLTQYRFPTPKADKKLLKRLEEENFDLIHINSPYPLGSAVATYAKNKGIPIVSTFHSQYRRDIYKITRSKFITNKVIKYMMNVFNKSDLCLTMNAYSEKLFLEYGGKVPCEILPNASCVKMPEIPLENYKEKVREEYGIKDGNVFLFAGRLIADKGIFLALDAMKKLKEDGVEFTMLYVGSGLLGKKLNKKIKKYKLTENVKTLGLITDKEKLLTIYALSDLFIFPSVYDTDGIVKREAAFVETPSLCAIDTGAGSDITDNVNGYLAEGNAIAFANRIKEIIEDKTKLREIGKNAKRDLCVTWEEINDNLFRIYSEIIDKKQKNG